MQTTTTATPTKPTEPFLMLPVRTYEEAATIDNAIRDYVLPRAEACDRGARLALERGDQEEAARLVQERDSLQEMCAHYSYPNGLLKQATPLPQASAAN
jgi:hypothetical protein